MTTNAFIFSWDCHGLEAVIPITQYEHWDKENTIRLLKEQSSIRNPLNSIIQSVLMRAQLNPQRNYEVYAADCDSELDEKYWREAFAENPQHCANIIREYGHKLYSNRMKLEERVIV